MHGPLNVTLFLLGQDCQPQYLTKSFHPLAKKEERKCVYNVIQRRVRVTTVAV
jgi:hypothetical protein